MCNPPIGFPWGREGDLLRFGWGPAPLVAAPPRRRDKSRKERARSKRCRWPTGTSTAAAASNPSGDSLAAVVSDVRASVLVRALFAVPMSYSGQRVSSNKPRDPPSIGEFRLENPLRFR